MTRLISTLLTGCTMSILWGCAATPPDPDDIPPIVTQAITAGQVWVGTIHASGGVPVRLTTGSLISSNFGTIEYLGSDGAKSMRLTESSWSGGKVHIAWSDDKGRATLDGKLSGGQITGTFKQGNTSAPAFLARGARADSASLARLFGLYEIEPRHLIWIGPVNELGGAPGYIDARTGRAGFLFAETPTRFFSGSTAYNPFPVGLHIDHGGPGNPKGNAVLWWSGSTSHSAVRKVETYTTEEVSFNNRGVRLSGTLIRPKSDGPHPAVVFIHGAEAQHRTYFSSLPYLLAHNGVATLIYDKRGVGKSTGNWRTSRFVDFVDDAIAGVHFLQRRSDIARNRVGIYGHSVGGWHAQLAALRSSGDVAFAVIAAGPAKDHAAQMTDDIVNSMRAAGLSDTDLQKARAHQNLYWRVVRKRAPWDSLAASTQRARTEPWGRFVAQPTNLAAVLGDTLEYFDPAPVLAKLTIPVLAIYSSNDMDVNASENAALMKAALARAGNRDATVIIMPEADHDFWLARTRGNRDLEKTQGYARRFLPTVVDWIVKQAKPRAAAKR